MNREVGKELVGTEIVCPGCGETFIVEIWRPNDLLCCDGQLYCVGCLTDDKCGCKDKAQIV